MSYHQQSLNKRIPTPEFQDAVLKCLSHKVLNRTFEPNQHIISEGDVCDAAYFIVEGTVRVYKLSPQGRQHILVQLGPGQAFNTVPVFLTESTNIANAIAVTPVKLLVLFKDQVSEIVKLCPDLALVFIHDFAERLSHLSNLAGDLALQPVRVRLARFLLEQVKEGQTTRWTHEEIAAHIGSVREVVSRTMRDFVKQGLIHKDRQHLVIVDQEALKIQAEG